ncbi:recombination mediator RecR [Oceanithermus sp.]|uniref:recombination mediator RecR n=1 Tax=Oceanithermus sp. TaxID=2268145 RepID=UPI002600B3ED|nr:recombination mediator RecR [Oceanithermus sp.]
MKYPDRLLALIRALSRLPGVGPKSAQKLGLYLAQNKAEAGELAAVIEEVRRHVGVCERCGNLAEGPLCPVCADPTRDEGVIAVVETAADVLAIEKSGEFTGVYHVLGGVLNPLEGVGPEALRIEPLLERAERAREVILATSMTVEGEATAAYLSDLLAQKGVKLSRPAYGLPVGGTLEYVDEITLARALAHRQPVTE